MPEDEELPDELVEPLAGRELLAEPLAAEPVDVLGRSDDVEDDVEDEEDGDVVEDDDPLLARSAAAVVFLRSARLSVR